jgi:hypothetical protein
MAKPEKREWTLMFYYAGDNLLSPFIVSQLKAFKEAGYHEDCDVVVYFDPSERGVPTRIYDVNRRRKKDRRLPPTLIGDGEDPFVHNLEDDDICLESKRARAGSALAKMNRTLENPDAVSAAESLTDFLNYCRENHQAKHYILFLIGHGMIVANDAFLPDENPVSGVTLKELDGILRGFAGQVKKDRDAFELLALHSCSMSAVEVAYQLKGTANYMMASEGTSYVNCWPHRQLLKKLFKTVQRAQDAAREYAAKNNQDPDEAAKNSSVDVPKLMEKLYFLSLFNARDFRLSGYPLDLALCSLAPEKFKDLGKRIQKLVAALKRGLKNSRGNELILLAHWEAQSYWEERYTDLYDFCRCLRARCDKNNELRELSSACSGVIKTLEPRKLGQGTEREIREEHFKGLVIHADNFGSQYQYSHGLSVYFPWARPVENKSGRRTGKGTRGKQDGQAQKGILSRYETEYSFTTDLRPVSWFDFLDSYFDETQRKQTRDEEDGRGRRRGEKDAFVGYDLYGRVLAGGLPVRESVISLEKPQPSSGVACACPSIKNYPEEKRERRLRGKVKLNVKKTSTTKGATTPPEDMVE